MTIEEGIESINGRTLRCIVTREGIKKKFQFQVASFSGFRKISKTTSWCHRTEDLGDIAPRVKPPVQNGM